MTEAGTKQVSRKLPKGKDAAVLFQVSADKRPRLTVIYDPKMFDEVVLRTSESEAVA